MNIFELVGSIMIQNDDANSKIDETTSKASTFGEKLSSGITTAAKWGTAIVGGATVAAAGLAKFAESSAATADNIDKMSQKIGISREAYQELDFICSQSGTSVDSLQAGMKKLNDVLANAQQASLDAASAEAELEEQLENGTITLDEYNKKYDEIYDSAYASCGGLEQLGFSLDEIEKMSPEDALFATIQALQSMPNDAKRAALAQDLLGKSSQELAPLLNSGVGSIDEMKQQAHELGLVLSDDVIDNGVELTDSLDQTKRAFKSIVTQLGGSLMPIVTQVSDRLQESLPTIQGMIDEIAPVISELLSGLLPPLMELAESLFPVLISLVQTLLPPLMEFANAVIPIIVNLVQTLLPPLMDIVNMVLPLLVELLNPLLSLLSPILDLLSPILNLIVSIIEPLVNILNLILPPLIEVLNVVISILSDRLSDAINVVAKLMNTVLGTAFENIKIIIATAKVVFSNFIDFFKNVFTGNWSAAWNNIKTIFSSVWAGIKAIFKNYVNGILGGVETLINGVVHAINGLLSGIGKVVSTVGDLLGLDWKMPTLSDISLPRLAKGGILEAGEVGLLEGDGAEAVVPLEKNREWIARVSEEMQLQGIGGNKETLDVLQKMLDALNDLKESNAELPDTLTDAISGLKFSINNREFARLVKAV